MDTLLDEQEPEESIAKRLLESVRWWERRRLLYTGILIGGGVLGIFEYGQGYLSNGELLFFTGLYLLAANLFYCLGWGIELLLWVHLKVVFSARQALFIIGTVFSVLLTYAICTTA